MGRVYCDICGVSCTSPRSLSEHVLGQKHRTQLARLAPNELENLGRLQYFVDKYMKGEPILGLEYLVERRVDFSYLYTCLLCNVEEEWRKMLTHVTDLEHAECYIQRHHHELVKDSSHLPREQQVHAMWEVARMIYAKFGAGEIRVKRPNSPTACLFLKEDDKKNGALPSTSDDSPQDSVKEGKDPDVTTFQQGSECKKDSDIRSYSCAPCGVNCSSPVALCEHVLGKLHKKNLELNTPEQLEELGRLGNFLNSHLKVVPILGLEYILEMKLGSSYKYTCRLCNMVGSLQKIVSHITDVDHAELYVKKHHADLLPAVPDLKKGPYVKAMRETAVKILEKYGSKEIQVKNTSCGGLPMDEFVLMDDDKTRQLKEEEEGDTPPFTDSGIRPRIKRRPLPYREVGSKKMLKRPGFDGPPLAKRGKVVLEGHQDALPFSRPVSKHRGPRYQGRLLQDVQMHAKGVHATTAAQELEFHTNDQFLQYLANFSIDNDEDVVYIQKITQNCIKALTGFQREVTERETYSRWPEAHTSRTDRETSDTSMSSRRPEGPLAHSSRTGRQIRDLSRSRYRAEAPSARTRRPGRNTLDISRSSRRPEAPLAHRRRTGRETLNISKSRRRPGALLGHKSRAGREAPDISKSSRRAESPLGHTRRTSRDTPEDSKSSRRPESPLGHTRRTGRETPEDLKSSRRPESPLAHTSRTSRETLDTSKSNRQSEASLAHIRSTGRETPDISKASHRPEAPSAHISKSGRETPDISKSSYQSEAPLEPPSRTDQETPDISVNKTELQSSSSETSLHKDTSNPFTNFVPKNEITDFFFSSIKNMDESEVVGIFRKIATTNPEFQGMDIPSVIRFLKESGRLK